MRASLTSDDLLQHVGFVQSLARQLVADPHLADDAAQETIATALQHRPRNRRSVRPWLSAILRNSVRQWTRSEHRRNERERATARGEGLPSTLELVDRLSMHRSLVDAVQRLDEPFRSTILLRFFDGRSLREIAAECGVPTATVNSRIIRGLAKLRSRLDERHGDRRAWVGTLIPLIRAERSLAPVAVLAVLITVGLAVFAVVRLSSARETEPAVSPPSATATDLARPDTGVRRLSGPRVAAGNGARVDGVVVGADGTPLADVATSYLVDERRSSTVRSDERGRVSFVVGESGRIAVADPDWVTVLAGVCWLPSRGNHVVVAAPPATVRGSVVDANGAPLADVAVAVELPPDLRARSSAILDGSIAEAWEVRSATDGGFELPRVPAIAGIRLVATRPDYAVTRRTIDALPAGWQTLVLERSTGADSFHYSGVIRDDRGDPIAGATVVAAGEIRRTDQAGRFGLHVVTMPARLTVVAAGFAPAVVEAPAPGHHPIRMSQAPQTLRGIVVDPRGEPLRGVSVWITNPTVVAVEDDLPIVAESLIDPTRHSWHIVRTDADGRFEIDSLLDRSYDLRCQLAGDIRFGEFRDARPGEPAELIWPTEPTWPRVAGIVRDSDGRAVRGAKVVTQRPAIRIPADAERGMVWFTHGRELVTGPDGAFELFEVARVASVHAGGRDLIDNEIALSAVADVERLELVVDRRAHLQVTAPGADSFHAEDAHGVRLQLRLGLGDRVRKLETVELSAGRSPVLQLPQVARTVVLSRAGEVIERVRIRPVVGQVTRIER